VNSKKEIWINGKFLSSPVTGVQRFSWGMCHALDELGFQLNLLVNKDVLFQPSFGQLIHVGNLSGALWEQVELPHFLKKQGSPMLLNMGNVAPVSYSNNFVVIHDAATLEPHPEWFSYTFRTWYRWLLPQLAKRAKLATVSEFSAKRLAHFLDLDIADILVLYNGVYFHQSNPEAQPLSLPNKPYILSIGSQNPRKGLDLLISAFLGNLKLSEQYTLVIVGAHSHHFRSIEQIDHPSISWLQHVSDEELIKLYENSKLVVVPSRYEGFGIPVLEALNFNKPVLCNDIEPFREIYGDAVEYTSFEQASSASQKMEALLTNESSSLSKKSRSETKSAFELKKCSFITSAMALEACFKKSTFET